MVLKQHSVSCLRDAYRFNAEEWPRRGKSYRGRRAHTSPSCRSVALLLLSYHLGRRIMAVCASVTQTCYVLPSVWQKVDKHGWPPPRLVVWPDEDTTVIRSRSRDLVLNDQSHCSPRIQRVFCASSCLLQRAQ